MSSKDEENALFSSAAKGDVEAVKELLAKDMNVNRKNKAGNTLLHRAAENGNSEVLKALLESGKCNKDTPNTEGKTPFKLACLNGHASCVKELLAKGAKDDFGNSALFTSALEGHTEVVKLLLAAQSQPPTKLKDMCTALADAAAKNGHLECYKAVLAFSGTKSKDPVRDILFQMAEKGPAEAVAPFLSSRKNVSLNITSEEHDGMSLLSVAAMNNNAAMVRALLEHGAKPNFKGRFLSPLAAAGMEEKLDVMEALIAAGADVNETEGDIGLPMITRAVVSESYEVARLLLKHKAKVGKTDREGRAPIHYAVNSECLPMVKLLIEEGGAKVDATKGDGATPLIQAALKPNVAIVRYLVQQKAPLNQGDSTGSSALLRACDAGVEEGAKVLIELGADVNKPSRGGDNFPLMAAIKGDHPKPSIVKLLAASGRCDFSLADRMGMTGLVAAVMTGQIAVAKVLLEAGASPDPIVAGGLTPLILCCERGGTELSKCARLLIEFNANVNHAANDGCNALHFAAFRGHEALVRLLLEAGADYKKRSVRGDLPEEMAAAHGKPHITKIIRDFGKKKTLETMD